MKSTCSAASRRDSRPARGDVGAAEADADAVRVAIVSGHGASLCGRLQRRRAPCRGATHCRTPRSLARDYPEAGRDRPDNAARHGAHRRAPQPETGRDSGHRRGAGQCAVPSGDPDRTRARRTPLSGGCAHDIAEARPADPGRRRSAAARPEARRPRGRAQARRGDRADRRRHRRALPASHSRRLDRVEREQHRRSVQQPDRLPARSADQLVVQRPRPGKGARSPAPRPARRKRSRSSTGRSFARWRKPRRPCLPTPTRFAAARRSRRRGTKPKSLLGSFAPSSVKARWIRSPCSTPSEPSPSPRRNWPTSTARSPRRRSTCSAHLAEDGPPRRTSTFQYPTAANRRRASGRGRQGSSLLRAG